MFKVLIPLYQVNDLADLLNPYIPVIAVLPDSLELVVSMKQGDFLPSSK